MSTADTSITTTTTTTDPPSNKKAKMTADGGDDDANNPNNNPKIYMVTMSAPTNIAVIKYWGKADVAYNTPINDSVSVTLHQLDLKAVTTVAASPRFTRDRLWLNGSEEPGAATNKRFRACVDGVKRLAQDRKITATTTKDGGAPDYGAGGANSSDDDDDVVVVTKQDWQQWHIHVSSYNTFPTAAGLASSAAGYAALVAALAQLMNARETYPGELSAIARQGSGSACRSLYGGFVAWRAGSADNDWHNSVAEQITDEHHWPEMRALIMVVSDIKKDTSSTSGMGTSVATSTLLPYRAREVVPTRMETIIKAWRSHDFETFAVTTMKDSNQFHATCLDTYPPIFYMNDVSKTIIQLVTAYNKWKGRVCCAYTFDAGPNAVLYSLEQDIIEIVALMYHYFPPPPSSSSTATTTNGSSNSHDYLHTTSSDATSINGKVATYKLDAALLEMCDGIFATSKERTGGGDSSVRNLYLTQAGPGPQPISPEKEKANLDPQTGLNTYTPKTK